MDNIWSPKYEPKRNQKAFESAKTAYQCHEANPPTEEYLDSLNDTEFDNALQAYANKSAVLLEVVYDTLLKNIFPSEWERSFLSSFCACESKKISKKQADILSRMGESWEQGRRSIEYRFAYDGSAYIITSDGMGGYLTIRPLARG
jgi:hypothetical protein